MSESSAAAPTDSVEASVTGENTDSVLARVVAPTWWTAPCTERVLDNSALSPTDSVLERTV